MELLGISTRNGIDPGFGPKNITAGEQWSGPEATVPIFARAFRNSPPIYRTLFAAAHSLLSLGGRAVLFSLRAGVSETAVAATFVNASTRRPVGQAFQSVARRTQLLLTSVAVVLFAALLRHGLARQADGLLDKPAYTSAWLTYTAMFTAVMGVVSFLNIRSLGRWFDGRVARPLREMAVGLPRGNDASGEVAAVRTGVWHETTQIASRFHELLDTLAQSDARARRLEREAQRQILQQVRRFDRELRRAKDRAATDPLTSLRNRSFLEERLEPLFELHAAQKSELSAVMIDLDNFKVYNDSHGHQVGDALLRFVGALLRGVLRHSDHAVRYGGDEFLLLLSETDSLQAATIAERILKLFHQYTRRLDADDGVSMSAGVAAAREDGCHSGHELVNRADANLYVAKRGGKNGVARTQAAAIQ